MTRYVRVERHVSGTHVIRCVCSLVTYVWDWRRGDTAADDAEHHARTCPVVKIATERDQALATLARYRMPVGQ